MLRKPLANIKKQILKESQLFHIMKQLFLLYFEPNHRILMVAGRENVGFDDSVIKQYIPL